MNRRERWGLSWKGWLLAIGGSLMFSGILLARIYPFLSMTDRVSAHSLVVEGWVHDFAIHSAADEFHSGGYQRVFSTGGPVLGGGGYVNDFQTSASVGAERLQAMGIPADTVQMVPTKVLDRDRTYASALALRDWFHAHDFHPQAINVLTEGPHARRTRLLFQRAFGSELKVGIIAIQTPDYDEKRWWHHSEGLKDVLNEGIAYIYARLFF